MSKRLILSLINIKLATVVLLFLAWYVAVGNGPGVMSFSSHLLLFTWFGSWALYQLFLARHIFVTRISKQKFDLPRFSLLTMAPVLFQGFFLASWFFATDFSVIIGLVLLSLVLFIVARKSSPRFGLAFTGLALTLIFVSSFLGFKDSYCWETSTALEDKMIEPSAQERSLLESRGIHSPGLVNQVLIARLKCQQEFSLANYLRR